MLVAKYDDYDTGMSFVAKGDECLLRKMFFAYMVDTKGIMFFDLLIEPVDGLEDIQDISHENYDDAYQAFREGKGTSQWFVKSPITNFHQLIVETNFIMQRRNNH